MAMRRQSHVVLSGSICSGKSTLALGLANAGFVLVSARDILQELAPESLGARADYQELGLQLERQTQGHWLDHRVARALRENPNRALVVDAVRTRRQLASVTHLLEPGVFHVHLRADRDVLEARFLRRSDPIDSSVQALAELESRLSEASYAELLSAASTVIDTTALDPDDAVDLVRELLSPRR